MRRRFRARCRVIESMRIGARGGYPLSRRFRRALLRQFGSARRHTRCRRAGERAIAVLDGIASSRAALAAPGRRQAIFGD